VTGGARPPSYPLLLLTVALGGVLAPLNSTMLAVALPELRDDFSLGHASIGWLISSYLIAMAVAQPLGGRIGDQLGRARGFRAGLVAFLALSLAAAAAPTFGLLVALRTGQALVGAAVIPNGMAMLRESLPADRLGRSMGLNGAAMSFAAAVGPLIGAGLLAAGSWRLLFLMNAPLVLAALLCLFMLRYPEPAAPRRLQLDWRGALTFGVALAALTLVLNSLRGDGGVIVLVIGIAGLLGFGALFYQTQRRSALPVVEWRLFRSRSYAGATGYVLLSNLVMYTTLVSIPFFIEEVQGKGSGTSGTLLGAMSILIAVIAPVAGRLSDSIGRRAPALAGSVIILGAMGMLLAGLSRDVSFGYLAAAMAVLGLGMGLSFGPASTAAIEAVARELAGVASGTNSMMRYIGSIVGVGILGAILGGEGSAPAVGLFRAIFAVLIGMSVAGVLAALLIHRRAPEEAASGLPAGGAIAPAGGT
jgi:EmrB/QacA subfamily drug resistance transporter